MKKLLVLFLALVMVFSLVACGDNGDNSATQAPSPSTAPEATEAPDVKSEGVLTYAQYADIDVNSFHSVDFDHPYSYCRNVGKSKYTDQYVYGNVAAFHHYSLYLGYS